MKYEHSVHIMDYFLPIFYIHGHNGFFPENIYNSLKYIRNMLLDLPALYIIKKGYWKNYKFMKLS